MGLILNIETSNRLCSVSLGNDGVLVDYAESEELNMHSKYLGVFINKLLKNNDLSIEDIDAVAVSKGPGSYTGLRIGVSMAKGLCFGLNKPLIGIMTHDILLRKAKKKIVSIKKDSLFISMTDARRNEVYMTIYNNNNEILKGPFNEIINSDSFSQYSGKEIYLYGDGSIKCKGIIDMVGINYIEIYYPDSLNMIELSECKYANREYEDYKSFVPLYVKSFYTTAKPVDYDN